MPKQPLDPAQIFGILRSVGVGKRKARILVPIAQRESGGRYWVNNAGTNSNGTVDHGLFQINDIWRNDPDIQRIGWNRRYNPVANAEMAKVVLHKQGLKAWSTFTSADDKYIGPAAKGWQGSAKTQLAQQRASTPGMVGLTQPKFTERTGVDVAAYEKARKQALVGAFIAQRRPGSILARLLPQQAPSLADFTTTTNSFSPSRVTLTPGKPQRTPQSAATPIIKGAKPGVPAKHLTSIGGIHETAGLPGFPAKDYFAPAGSAVVAPVTGKVYKESGYDPKLGAVQGAGGPLGWSVYILGKNGKRYYLTHMGSRLVKVGQRVQQGQKIGTVANYDKYGRPSHIHMGIQG